MRRGPWCLSGLALLAFVLPSTASAQASTPVFGRTLSRVSFPTGGPGVSHQVAPYGVSVSGDGRYVAFSAQGRGWPQPTTGGYGVYVRDRVANITINASVGRGGVAANGDSYRAALSADGRYVAYESTATNLVTGDASDQQDVFLRDLRTGQVRLVSGRADGGQGRRASEFPSVSADGRFVAFINYGADLLPGSGGGCFLKDMQTGTLEVLSSPCSGMSLHAVSDDARYVAVNQVRGSEQVVSLLDRSSGVARVISDAPDGTAADGGAFTYALAGDGSSIAFESTATNVAPGDTTPRQIDTFVRDLSSGTTVLVKLRAWDGHLVGASLGGISGDGRRLSLQSALPAEGSSSGGVLNAYVYDRDTRSTLLASVGTSGQVGAKGIEQFPASDLSADGRHVAFHSLDRLTDKDGNRFKDVFVRDART